MWYCQYVFAEYIGNTNRQYSRCQFKRVSERVTYLRPLCPSKLISWCFYDVCYNVLRPLCNALDVLQGEHSAGLGYLLHTLTVVKNQLSDSNQSLAICKPLEKAVMTGIDKRFSETLNDLKCQLAALAHSMFNLDWGDDVAFESTLTDLLKRHLTASVRSESPSSTAAATSDHESPTSAQPSSSFLAQLSARRKTPTTAVHDVVMEVDGYLADISTSLYSLNNYPHIKQMFIAYLSTRRCQPVLQ